MDLENVTQLYAIYKKRTSNISVQAGKSIGKDMSHTDELRQSRSSYINTNKIIFKAKKIIRDRHTIYNGQGSIHHENITILRVHGPNHQTAKQGKGKLAKITGRNRQIHN